MQRPTSHNPARLQHRHAPIACADCAQYEKRCHSDQRFMELLDAYRATGGLARAKEVTALQKRCTEPDRRALARRIGGRELISFEWQAQAWLPLFQFERLDMNLQPGLTNVLRELVPVFDAWEVAEWFINPTAALNNNCPVDMLAHDAAGVLDAARMNRFVIDG